MPPSSSGSFKRGSLIIFEQQLYNCIREHFEGKSFEESGSHLDEEVMSLSYKIIYIIDMPYIFTGS